MTDENRLVFKEDLGDQSEIVATDIENGINPFPLAPPNADAICVRISPADVL